MIHLDVQSIILSSTIFSLIFSPFEHMNQKSKNHKIGFHVLWTKISICLFCLFDTGFMVFRKFISESINVSDLVMGNPVANIQQC